MAGVVSFSQAQTFSLDWLLDPIAVTDFFSHHWETDSLLVKGRNPAFFRDLPGLGAVDELITATTPGGGHGAANDVCIVKTDGTGGSGSRPVQLDTQGIPDIQKIYRAYHEGYSIVVNQVHRRSSAVALLCRGLEISLHHPVGCNLYLTPRGAQGFRPHLDTHDVFILQLHGEKIWHVGSPSKALPLASEKGGPIDSRPDWKEFKLEPGDVLYLPRGFPHDAATAVSSSLHLTVGIYCQRWVDLFSEMLALVAAEQIEFRSALPPKFLDCSFDSAHVSSLVHKLTWALCDSALRERAKERLATKLLEAGKAAGRDHFRSIDAISELTEETVVVRTPGLLCRVRCTSEEAIIEFATNYVSGPRRLEPALRFIAERERFVIRELPALCEIEDKIDIVARLISEGLIKCS